MEVSAKQEGAKRFDDPGIAAALAGDTDPDGPGGGLLSGVVNRGKLEPKVPSLFFMLILPSVSVLVPPDWRSKHVKPTKSRPSTHHAAVQLELYCGSCLCKRSP